MKSSDLLRLTTTSPIVFERDEEYHFLNGVSARRSEHPCRGCFIEQHPELFDGALAPIAQNEYLVLRQDAEFPVPGFVIVSTRQHVHSIGAMDSELAQLLGMLLAATRRHMAELLCIDRINIYHEEKLTNPHFHMWMLPIWRDVTERNMIEPRVWECNIPSYLSLFNVEHYMPDVLKANSTLRRALLADPTLSPYGFR